MDCEKINTWLDTILYSIFLLYIVRHRKGLTGSSIEYKLKNEEEWKEASAFEADILKEYHLRLVTLVYIEFESDYKMSI